jgi:pimeloyl-ACP methyl ester carboxylesterase
MYQPRLPSHSEFVPIRTQRYHVRHWGAPVPGQPPLVLLHGWMDVSASWQFVVDALRGARHVIAPDWRGFGLTEGPPTDHYWFPDYLADLDFLLDHYAPDMPVNLVGHSMGGNVSMLYAGARPQRLRSLTNLEGFGLPPTRPAQAPGRHARWMDQLKAFHQGHSELRTYEDVQGVAERLVKTNRRLAPDHALWLAQHWARPDADGRWRILGDAAHKITSAVLFRAEEMVEAYRRIEAPVMWIQADEDSLPRWHGTGFTQEQFQERLSAVPQLEQHRLADAGHMLHHDQPLQVAQLLETFLAKIR